jgi:hypothetical protein
MLLLFLLPWFIRFHNSTGRDNNDSDFKPTFSEGGTVEFDYTI